MSEGLQRDCPKLKEFHRVAYRREAERWGLVYHLLRTVKLRSGWREAWLQTDSESDAMTAFSDLEAVRRATEDVTSTAEQFYKLYYDSVDSKRHLVNRLYLDTAVFIWNGNAYQNLPEIQKFYEQLPTTSHVIQVVDSQLLSTAAVGAQKTLLIQTAGKVRIHDVEKSYRPFQQVFIVTAQGDKWKIVSDCYRLQLPIDSLKDGSPEEQLQKLQLGLDLSALTGSSSGVQNEQALQFQQQQQIQQQQQFQQMQQQLQMQQQATVVPQVNFQQQVQQPNMVKAGSQEQLLLQQQQQQIQIQQQQQQFQPQFRPNFI